MTICHSVMGNTGKQDLQVKYKAMNEKKEIKSQALVELVEFGPIKITGNFIIKDFKRDKEDTSAEVYLCRCGHSANKPYCDDSHKK